MKWHSNDDLLNELDFVLANKRTASARATLREAKRRYRELNQHFSRLLRVTDSGAFDRQPPPRLGTTKGSAGR